GRTTLTAQLADLKQQRDALQSRLNKAAVDADNLSNTIANLEGKAAAADKYKQDLANLKKELARVGAQARAASASAAARPMVTVVDGDHQQPEGADVPFTIAGFVLDERDSHPIPDATIIYKTGTNQLDMVRSTNASG